jgi:hypothetical protein
VVGVGGEGDLLVLQAGEQVRRFACLEEVAVGDENGVVVAEEPEAIVEQPVGVFGEGDAVVQVVVSAPGELVDVDNEDRRLVPTHHRF